MLSRGVPVARLSALRLAPRVACRTYHQNIIDHYESPRNVGSLDKNDPNVGTGLVGAPACGDVMKLQFRVGKDGKIEEAVFKVSPQANQPEPIHATHIHATCSAPLSEESIGVSHFGTPFSARTHTHTHPSIVQFPPPPPLLASTLPTPP